MKICLDAGHGYNTAGKRCLKSIDPKETREWFLNQRIVSKLEDLLRAYNVSVIRVDDPSGKTDIPLKSRTDIANAEKCDLYLSFHHDAGANGTSAGGISVFSYDDRPALKDLKQQIYRYLIQGGGLTGRSQPLRTADFHVLRETKMNAILVEHGFMDSTKDTPIILTEEYADKMAHAWLEFLKHYYTLIPKEVPNTDNSKLYRVQCGAFKDKANAEKLVKKLRDNGYDAIIV